MSNRDDIEAGVIGGLCLYEFIAICLRRTRWTNYCPPLTRILHRHWLVWEFFLHAQRMHFVNYKKGKG